ncbi:MAG: pilus assembly PilX N-terminal domain-containing protein, partial [Patescibacteria group bacterium]
SKLFSRATLDENMRGFALIYVLLFITLIGVTVFASWAASLSETRLSRRNEHSTEAYQLAKTAIEEGWEEYRAQLDDSMDPLDIGKNLPDEACDLANPQVQRVIDGVLVAQPVGLKPYPDLTQTKLGVYDWRVCGDDLFIEGVGYYKGNKITLKAKIDHTLDNDIVDGDGNITGRDHRRDTLKIYQTGPSI